jgi:hypothetical protein
MSGSLAMFTAIRRASARVSRLAAEFVAPAQFGTRNQLTVLARQDFAYRTVQV